jgi:hypothetical protein
MNINEVFPSKFLKAADLGGATPTVTIDQVKMEDIGDDRRAVVYFVGKDKGVVLNKTNATNISEAYGPDTDGWTGKKVTLFTAWVDFQGKSMEAIRIRRPDMAPAAQPSGETSSPPQFNEPGDPGFPGDIEF